MNARGPDGPESTTNDTPVRPAGAADSRRRLGNPTRLVPRRTTPPPPDREVLDGEPVAPPSRFDSYGPPPGGTQRSNPLFGPRSFGNGRIQVWGCSPGCLIASLIASVALTILLNIVF